MLVVDTKPKKEVKRKGRDFPEWIHTVHLQDEQGGNYYVETWLSHKEQKAIIPGEDICFYVEFDGTQIDEIVLLDCEKPMPGEPIPEKSAGEAWASLPDVEKQRLLSGVSEKPWQPEHTGLIDLLLMSKLDLRLVALLIAKDIFAAQVLAGKLEGTPQEISWLFTNADVITRHLESMNQEKPFSK